MDDIESERAYHKHRVERQKRMHIVMIAVPALFGTLIWLASTGGSREFLILGLGLRPEVLTLIVVLMYAASGLALMLTYLQTGFKTPSLFEYEARKFQEENSDWLNREELSEIRRTDDIYERISELEESISRTKESIGNIDSSGRATLVEDLKASLQRDAAASVLSELRDGIAAEQERTSAEVDLAARLDDSRNRILKELEALGWRGNLNLGLGAITTIIGISLLGVSVFAETGEPKDMASLIAHFLPRLTLVLLIELFAFFFLSLYKSSLSEIKYFQNEITNIECWQSALRVAAHDGSMSLLAGVVSSLSATERNNVLAKGESTIELERARIDQRSHSGLAKALAEVIRGKG